MKVLFFTLSWPDPGDDHMYKDLMQEFVENQHDVHVVCPWEKRRIPAVPYQIEDGMHVVRFQCGNIQKQSNKYIKTINLFLLNLQVIQAIHRWFSHIKFDLIIFTTPPITMSPTFRYLKRKYNASYYLLMKDIWPQDAVDAGAMSKGGIVWAVFRFLEKMTYKDADVIGCGSQANVEYILKNNSYLKQKKVEVCPNSVKLTQLNSDLDIKMTRRMYDIPLDKVIFVFGGNLGDAQGLEFLIDAAEKLRSRKDVFFLVIGNGTQYEKIKNRVEKGNLTNISLRPPIPKADFMNILKASDVGLIMLNKYFTVPNIPTKFIDYLQVGLPILCAVDKATDVGHIVEHAGCGFSCINGEMDQFLLLVDKYVDLKNDPAAIKLMNDNARQLFVREYTTEKAYNTIMKHFSVESRRVMV